MLTIRDEADHVRLHGCAGWPGSRLWASGDCRQNGRRIASRASAGHYFEPTVYNFGMTSKRLDDGATQRTVGSAAHVLQLVRFQFPAQRAAVVQLGFHGLSPCRGGLDQWGCSINRNKMLDRFADRCDRGHRSRADPSEMGVLARWPRASASRVLLHHPQVRQRHMIERAPRETWGASIFLALAVTHAWLEFASDWTALAEAFEKEHRPRWSN
jgi:hypothetical protein